MPPVLRLGSRPRTDAGIEHRLVLALLLGDQLGALGLVEAVVAQVDEHPVADADEVGLLGAGNLVGEVDELVEGVVGERTGQQLRLGVARVDRLAVEDPRRHVVGVQRDDLDARQLSLVEGHPADGRVHARPLLQVAPGLGPE